MIIIDTEYTTWPGALESGWAEDWQHREVVQLAAIMVNDDFVEMHSLDVIVRPVVNQVLSPLFLDLTGISQATVNKGVIFLEAAKWFENFVGNQPIICMNADEGVMRENYDLHGLPFDMPSWHRLRPFLEAQGIDLSSRSSGDLHALTPYPLEGHTHNALHDVRSMARWLEVAKREGVFTGVDQLPTGVPLVDPRSIKG